MVHMAAQGPALMNLVLVVAVQAPAFRVKAIKVVLINSLTKEASCSSLAIKATQSSWTAVSITCSLRVYAREIRKSISGR